MTLAFFSQAFVIAFCRQIFQTTRDLQVWTQCAFWGVDELLNRLLFSLEDILMNTHKTDQDLGKTVSWRPEDFLVFFLVHMWVERSWIPENITEFPLHQSTIQVKLVMLTRKKYFCLQFVLNRVEMFSLSTTSCSKLYFIPTRLC